MNKIEERLKERKRSVSMNISAALRAAIQHRTGKKTKVNKSDVLRETGVARSTLAALMNPDELRNADLHTMQKIADYVGVPLPFLLMGPSEWKALTSICRSFMDYESAADARVVDVLNDPKLAEVVLRDCKVHPTPAPIGVSPDDPLYQEEFSRLAAQNHWRQKSSWTIAAIAQPAAKGDRAKLVELTAFSAALAHMLTPHNV